MNGELRRGAPLLILLVVGLAAGIWIALAPWAVGFPSPPHAWSGSIWTNVWIGGIVAAASAVSLVAVFANAVHTAIEARPEGR